MRVEGGHGRSELGLVCNQTSHDQLSVRRSGERLGHGENAFKPVVVPGKDEHGPIRLDSGELRQVERAILHQNRALKLA